MNLEIRSSKKTGQGYEMVLRNRIRRTKQILIAIFAVITIVGLSVSTIVFLYSVDSSSETFIKK